MDLLNETVLLMTKITLFNLLIRETSQFLCYERLLNMTYVAYKNAFFREMQFWLHCYTVVSYQALFRLSVCKIPAVYLSGAINVCFCTIRDFGSPTKLSLAVGCSWTLNEKHKPTQTNTGYSQGIATKTVSSRGVGSTERQRLLTWKIIRCIGFHRNKQGKNEPAHIIFFSSL